MKSQHIPECFSVNSLRRFLKVDEISNCTSCSLLYSGIFTNTAAFHTGSSTSKPVYSFLNTINKLLSSIKRETERALLGTVMIIPRQKLQFTRFPLRAENLKNIYTPLSIAVEHVSDTVLQRDGRFFVYASCFVVFQLQYSLENFFCYSITNVESIHDSFVTQIC